MTHLSRRANTTGGLREGNYAPNQRLHGHAEIRKQQAIWTAMPRHLAVLGGLCHIVLANWPSLWCLCRTVEFKPNKRLQ